MNGSSSILCKASLLAAFLAAGPSDCSIRRKQPFFHQEERLEEIEPPKTTYQASWESCLERSKRILRESNPLVYIPGYVVSYSINRFLVSTQREGQNNFSPLLYEGTLLYFFHVIRASLRQGVLHSILKPLQSIHIIHRLVTITFYTAYMGSVLLIPSPIISLAVLLFGTLVLSILTCLKENEPKAYVVTNIIFMILFWIVIQLSMYLLVEGMYLNFLFSSSIDDSDNEDKKRAFFRSQLITHANLGILALWKALKNHIYIREENGEYRPLTERLIDIRPSWVNEMMTYIDGLGSPAKEICTHIVRNVGSDLIRHLFL